MPQKRLPEEHHPVRLQRILFATDFSPTAAMALPYAAAIARRFNAEVYVTHVIPADEYQHIQLSERDATLRQMKQSAEERIRTLLTSSHLNNISFQILLEHGDILEVISALVATHNIDLIVAGSHGRHGIHKMFSPPVEEGIAQAVRCPALLIGPQAEIDPEANLDLKRILYATDFAAESGPALDYAYTLANAYDSDLYIFHVAENVWKEPLSTRMTPEEFCRMRLLENGLPLNDQGIEPRYLVDFGPAESLILEAAQKRQVQLIVVSVPEATHPHLSSHLPGPMAYNLASHARCPVLGVRSTAQEAEKS
jgi:universal stress protein A